MNINTTFAHELCASPTGIDKLSLYTRDFTIRDGKRSGLTVQPAIINLSDGQDRNLPLFKDGNGKQYNGAKAYRNDELCTVNINQHGLNVILNPSKPYHPYELCRDEATLEERLNTVYKHLQAAGIKANYGGMTVSRIDLARNGSMNNPCPAYLPVFSGLGFARAKRQATYPDGHSINNNTFGLTFYNKGKEAGTDRENLLRAELQFKKAKGSNFKGLYIGKVEDIAEVGFSHLNETYTGIMQGQVFKTDSFNGQQLITFADTLQQLNVLKEIYGPQRALTAFVGINGIEATLEATAGLDGYRRLLKQYGVHRNTIRKKLNEAQRYLALRSQMQQSKTIGKLYREMWRQFAA